MAHPRLGASYTLHTARPAHPRPSPAAVGDSWNSTAAGLVLRFFRVTRTGEAVLRVCRRGGPETLLTCQRGLDNDCNGLAGAADPACLRLLRRRPARTA